MKVNGIRLKWQFGEKPRGQFRSFESRAWPVLIRSDNEDAVAKVHSSVSYSPKYRTSPCPEPLDIYVADYRPEHTKSHGRFRWRKLRRPETPIRTFEEAKRHIESFGDSLASFWGELP